MDAHRPQVRGGEWSLAATLAHIAIWDRRATGILRRGSAGFVPPHEPDWYGTELLNEALVPLRHAVDGDKAGALALHAAREVDAEVEALESGLADEITMAGERWLLDRRRHRSDHLAEVERALRP